MQINLIARKMPFHLCNLLVFVAQDLGGGHVPDCSCAIETLPYLYAVDSRSFVKTGYMLCIIVHTVYAASLL